MKDGKFQDTHVNVCVKHKSKHVCPLEPVTGKIIMQQQRRNQRGEQ